MEQNLKQLDRTVLVLFYVLILDLYYLNCACVCCCVFYCM